MGRCKVYGLVIAVAVIAVAGILWLVERPKLVTVAVDGHIFLDDTPLGDAVFNAERLTAEFQASLVPGRYNVQASAGVCTLEVPDASSVTGSLKLLVTDRGQDGKRRWVTLRAEPSRLTFTPHIRVIDPRGAAVALDEVSANKNAATLSIEPLVGQSVANWVANRVWSGSSSEAGRLETSPIQDVTVSSGRLVLRDGASFHWRGAAEDDGSYLGLGPGSEVMVRDLAVTGSGSITSGRLSAKLSIRRDSLLREKKVDVRMTEGELTLDLTVSRASGWTRVALTDGTTASLRLNHARVNLSNTGPELAAERVAVILDQAAWAQQYGAEASATFRGRIDVTGVTSPTAPLAGMRIESVTAMTNSGTGGVQLDSVRVQIPKAAAISVAMAAVPKAFPLGDQLLAPNVLDLFHDLKLANVAFEPRQLEAVFQKEKIVISCQPVIQGKIAALGRHDVVKMRMQQIGPIKTNVPYHEITWVPRVDLQFVVPLTLNGYSTVEIVPGLTLADAKLKIRTNCDSVTIGEPTVQGLPDPLKPLVQLAAKFRNEIRVDGKSLPDHIKALATREDLVLLMGTKPDPKLAALFRQVELSNPVISESGDNLVFVASIRLLNP